MGIIHLLIYYLGIQMMLSTLLYFYYLSYISQKCAEGEESSTPPSTQRSQTLKKIMNIILICAVIAVLYHSYLDVKYRH